MELIEVLVGIYKILLELREEASCLELGRHFGVHGEVMTKLKPEEQVSLAKNL